MTTTSIADDPRGRVLKRKLSSLVVAHIANDSYFGFLPPILAVLREQTGLPIIMAGLLYSTFSFTGAVGQPLFGYLSDRIRQGWLVALGPVVGALMTLLIYMPNYISMFLLLLVAGTGSACFHPVASVIAAQISGTRKGLGVSIYVSGGRLGVGLGGAASTFIVTNWGLEAIPYAGIVGVLIGLPFFFITPRIEGSADAKAINFSETLKGLTEVRRSLILMWLVNLCRTTVTMCVGAYMPIYIVEGGGSVAKGGWLFTLFLFAAAGGGIYGGHLSDRLGRRTVMIGGLLFGTPVLALSFLSSGLLQIIFLMMAGAILYGPMGVSVTYAQEVAPEHKALVSSFMLGVVWFFGTIILIGIGGLGDLFEIVIVLPITCVVVGIIGTVLAFGLPKIKPS